MSFISESKHQWKIANLNTSEASISLSQTFYINSCKANWTKVQLLEKYPLSLLSKGCNAFPPFSSSKCRFNPQFHSYQVDSDNPSYYLLANSWTNSVSQLFRERLSRFSNFSSRLLHTGEHHNLWTHSLAWVTESFSCVQLPNFGNINGPLIFVLCSFRLQTFTQRNFLFAHFRWSKLGRFFYSCFFHFGSD